MEQPHRHSRFVALAGSRGSITLPADVRRRYHLDEPGAQVEVIGRPDGVIELHPVLPHRADQAWFWTERWQAMERDVLARARLLDASLAGFEHDPGAKAIAASLSFSCDHRGDHMKIVTVRDFRDRASEMFRSDDVILVTRDGAPAGFFLPWDTPELPVEVRREVFLRLSEQIGAHLAAQGESEQEVLGDFAASRRRR